MRTLREIGGDNLMPNYRRFYLPGGTFFLTIVTYNRTPLFSDPENVSRLRNAVATIKCEQPFEIVAAVVLSDHIHFIWTLPLDDTDYSKRIGRIKTLFTRSLRGQGVLPKNVSLSRRKRNESDVWNRRFWEHTILDEDDFEQHLNYIHYNPVKHNLVSCPHLWSYSSFHSWVKQGVFAVDWCCTCNGRQPKIPNFDAIAHSIGE
jgi:putative transposase